MIIKKKLSTCVVLSCTAFVLVGCSMTVVKAQRNQVIQKVSAEKSYFPYANLHELSIDKNSDSNRIKSVINKLPILAAYLEY